MNVHTGVMGTFCCRRQELSHRILSRFQTVSCRLSNSSVGCDPANPLFTRLHESPIAYRNRLQRPDSVMKCDLFRLRNLNSSLHDPGSPDPWQLANQHAGTANSDSNQLIQQKLHLESSEDKVRPRLHSCTESTTCEDCGMRVPSESGPHAPIARSSP